MKSAKVFIVFMFTAILMAVAIDLQAATARVRCRVEPGRLRIQVDGQDLPRGTYTARVKNARTGKIVRTEPSKVRRATLAVDDIDLDFDSTAGPTDLDSFVPANFARVGDTVRASVLKVNSIVVVAAASITCVSK